MKKLLLLSLLFVLAPFAHAQTSVTGQIMEGPLAVRPATCNPLDIYGTTDTYNLYQCGPANTWNQVAATVTTFAGTPTGTCLTNQIAVNTTNGYFYTCNSSAWQLVNAVQLKTNGTTNGSQVLFNLVNGVGINITEDGSGNVTVNTSSVPWSVISTFPSGCLAGQYVSSIGTTLTCSAPSGSTSASNVWTGSNTWTGSVTGVFPSCVATAYSSSPSYNVSFDTCIETTLTGNISSISLTGTPTSRTAIYLYYTQDSAGGHTITFPSNFNFPAGWTLNTGANVTNYLAWRYDGTNWQPILAFGGSSGGGGGTPAGGNGAVQIAAGGLFGYSGYFYDLGTSGGLQINEDTRFCGTMPYYDVRCGGVRAVPVYGAPSIPGTTGTISSGTKSLSLAGSQIFNFIPGDGIVVQGAGPTNGFSAPAAPTVTPVNDEGESNSLLTVASPTGGNTNQYQVCPWGGANYGAVGPCSSVTSISTAQTLGKRTVNISSISISGSTATVTTSSAHTMSAGAKVTIDPTTMVPQIVGGDYIVQSSSDNTHFVVNILGSTLNGLTNSATGGTATWRNGNRISLASAATGTNDTTKYVVYGRVSGSMAIVGVMAPQWTSVMSGDKTYLAFVDYGDIAPLLPYVVPNTPPGSAQNDSLVTTVTAVNGSTLTLAANASNSVVASPVLFDNGVTLAAASAVAKSASIPLVAPPAPSNYYYIVNSPTTLATGASFEVSTGWIFADTLQIPSGILTGLNIVNSGFSFQFQSSPLITINRGYPGIWSSNSNIKIKNVAFNDNSGGLTLLADGGSQTNIYDAQFSLTGDNSMGIWYRADHNGVYALPGHNDLNNANFLTGQSGNLDTPVIYDMAASLVADNMHLSGRGILFRPGVQGGQLKLTRWMYSQGNFAPFISTINADSGNIGTAIEVESPIEDTTSAPIIDNLGGLGGSTQLYGYMDFPSGPGNFFITGSPSVNVTVIGSPVLNPSNTGVSYLSSSGSVNNGTLGTSPVTAPYELHSSLVSINPAYSLFTVPTHPAAPSCTFLNSGGSIADGTSLAYAIVPVFPDASSGGSEGSFSQWCSGTTPTSGGVNSIAVSWTAVPGAVGYDLYQATSPSSLPSLSGGTRIACGVPGYTSTSTTLTSTSYCGNSAPTTPGGGPAGLQNGVVWANKGIFGLTDYQSQSAPANPVSGYCRVYFDSGSGSIKGITSTGASCYSSGSGIWNGIGNPTSSWNPTFYNGSTNYATNFHFIGSGTLTSMFDWTNDTAATSGTSQFSPQLALCGNAWHAAASAQDCFTFQNQPGNGTDANITFAFGHTGSSTGPVISSFPGPLTSGASGGQGGMVVLPEGTVPTTPYAFGTASQDNCYADSSAHHVLCKDNNGTTYSQTRTPTSVTSGDLACYSDASGAVLSDCGTLGSNAVTASGTLTSGQLMVGNGSKTITTGNLSGDATTSGSTTVTVVKVNGTSVPVNSAADQVVNTTASATGQWTSLPNCGSSSTALSYSTGTHSFGCQSITTGSNPPWNTIQNAAGNLSLSNGIYTTLFTSGILTGTNNDFEWTDGASTSTGNMLYAHTNASSTMLPFKFCAQGTSNCISMSTGGAVTASGSAGITATALSGVASTSLSDSSNLVRNNGSNTATSAMTLDLSAATGSTAFKIPVQAGCTSGADGDMCYDSTAKLTHERTNGADSISAATTTTDTTTTHALFASATAGVYTPRAIAVGDMPGVNTVVDTTATVTVSTTLFSEVHFNENATAGQAVTYNLPTAAANKQFCFNNASVSGVPNTGVLTLQTSAAGQYIIYTDGTNTASGGYVSSGGAAADGACVQGVDSTHWFLTTQRGVWAKH